jgi:PKD repeat protein
MKKHILSLLAIAGSFAFNAQTVIDFDTVGNWTAGASALGSYAADHSYSQGDFSAIGGEGLRNGSGAQSGFPGALGDYSWRLRNNASVVWTATIATGGVSTFSFAARAWDNSPSPDFTLECSTDMGTTWDSITDINNVTLNNSSDWSTFNGTINSANNDIMVRIRSNGTTERIMIDDFSWFAFGAGGTIDTIASISTADMSVMENIGTVDVTVTLNQTPVLDKTVELLLNSGNAAIVNGYTPQTVTFTGGSTSETVTLTVVSGQLASASETLEFGLNNAGTGLMYGSDTLFNLTVNEMPPAAAPCSDLYFSEYIEGSSNNKALEIYNPTTGIIDLSDYEIRKYNNGSSSVSTAISLSGSLTPGSVFVIAHSSADQIYLDQADMTSGSISHNGDDAYDLYKISAGDSIDVIGTIGNDPGSSWPVSTGSTQDFTLVRMANVDAGTTVWASVGDTQWDVYPIDDSVYLGNHINTACNAAIPLTAYPIATSMEVCLGDTIWFSHNSFGGTAPYTAGWEINAVQTVGDDLEYVTTTAGNIAVTFGIADGTLATDDSVFTIKVNALPTTGANFDNTTVCALDTANFASTATGVSAILSYDYALTPSGVLSDSLNGNGYLVPDTDGTFTLTQMVTDSLGCMATEDFTVTSNVLDDATFSALSNVCSGDTVVLSNTNTTGVWSGTVVTDQGSGNGYAEGAAGVYDITYTTSGACPDAHTESVEFYATPTAAFTFTGNITVDFTNTSTGGATCLWDLGDGTTSTNCDPSHTYSTDGNYTVCLTTTSNDGCTDSICQTIVVQGVGVNENEANVFSMYPNPTNGEVTIKTQAYATIQLINIVGEIVWTSNVQKTVDLDFSHLSKGSYFVKVNTNGKIETKKLIIQ